MSLNTTVFVALVMHMSNKIEVCATANDLLNILNCFKSEVIFSKNKQTNLVKFCSSILFLQ